MFYEKMQFKKILSSNKIPYDITSIMQYPNKVRFMNINLFR